MTPRLLDEESIHAKLRTMRLLLDHLATLQPVSRATFDEDFGSQLIAERILSQLVDLDMDVVVSAIPHADQDYGEYVRQVARWLHGRGR